MESDAESGSAPYTMRTQAKKMSDYTERDAVSTFGGREEEEEEAVFNDTEHNNN